MENDQDVVFARALKELNDKLVTPAYLDMLFTQARVAFARYQAAQKAGFTSDQALALCAKPVEF